MFDSETINHADNSYPKKKEGKLCFFAVLLILFYTLFTIGFFLLCYLTRLIPLFAVAPLLLWILVYMTWRTVSYDIYYTFESGKLTFYRRTGRKTRHAPAPRLTLRVQDAEGVYDGRPSREERADAKGKFYDFSSSKNAEETVLIRFSEGRRDTLVLFDVTPSIRDLIRRFAKENTCYLK